MDSQIKASFIPRKMPSAQSGATPPQGGGTSKASRSRNGLVDVLFVGSVVLLAASIAVAVGVFLYNQFMITNAQAKREQLSSASDAFEPTLISELVRLDERIEAASSILEGHLAPSTFFAVLGEQTLRSVQYERLDYREAGGEVTIALSGKASSVNAVALQADLFGEHPAIENPIFSNLNLVEDGVTFDVTATLNPGAVRYGSGGISVPETQELFETPANRQQPPPPPSDQVIPENDPFAAPPANPQGAN